MATREGESLFTKGVAPERSILPRVGHPTPVSIQSGQTGLSGLLVLKEEEDVTFRKEWERRDRPRRSWGENGGGGEYDQNIFMCETLQELI